MTDTMNYTEFKTQATIQGLSHGEIEAWLKAAHKTTESTFSMSDCKAVLDYADKYIVYDVDQDTEDFLAGKIY